MQRRGEDIARGQVGYADTAKKPIPKNALYRIYSMTKPITSVIALILIEQGKLRLYDMLPQFDKRFAQMTVLGADGSIAPAQRPITVEDLITHRAGFTYEFIPGCQIAQYYQRAEISSDGKVSLDEMMRRLSEQPIAFQPGSQWRYSVATDVLAHVCEKAAGRGIDELMKEYIFDPLGMNDTAYFVPAEKRNRLLPVYGITDLTDLAPLKPRPQELTPSDVEDMYPSNMPGTFRRGGHGLFSTTDDYAKFARMLLNGKTPGRQDDPVAQDGRSDARKPHSGIATAARDRTERAAWLRLGTRRARDDRRRPGDEPHRRRRTRLGRRGIDVFLGRSEGRTDRRHHDAVPGFAAADERRPPRRRVSDDRLNLDSIAPTTDAEWHVP